MQVIREEALLFIAVQYRQVRTQGGALEPLHYRLRPAGQRMVIGGTPHFDLAAMGAEDVVVLGGGMPWRMLDCSDLVSPWALAGDLAGPAMGRLVEIVRGLDGQAAALGQLPDQVRVQLGMIGQPLQRSVGEDHIHTLGRGPAGNVAQGEVDIGQALACGPEHVLGAVDAKDCCCRITLGQDLGRIARAAAQIDGRADVLLWQCRHQVAHRSSALVFEGAVLRRGPAHC
ncbi:hypothetical protein D3C79_713040 [compost metagenome]